MELEVYGADAELLVDQSQKRRSFTLGGTRLSAAQTSCIW